MAYDHTMEFVNDTIFTINQLGLQEVLTEQGFQEFKTRDVVCYVREIACRA